MNLDGSGSGRSSGLEWPRGPAGPGLRVNYGLKLDVEWLATGLESWVGIDHDD